MKISCVYINVITDINIKVSIILGNLWRETKHFKDGRQRLGWGAEENLIPSTSKDLTLNAFDHTMNPPIS